MSKQVDIEAFLKREFALILRLDESVINTDSSLESLGIDSMSFVELLIAIENKFGIRLIESGISKSDLNSIKALALRIEKEL